VSAGYLPLTKANGLGDLAGYTLAAAKAVAAQKGALPSLTGNPPPGTPKPSKSPTPTPSSSGSQSPNPHVSVPAVTTKSPVPVQSSPSVATTPSTSAVSLGRTLGINLGGGGLVVLLILGLALLGGLGGPATYFVGRKMGRW
jgi:hypothetical protein